jgi:metal-responsive CopG/Arc/MetJ family transcriptional regulator
MPMKRVPVLLPLEMLRNLDELAERYAMDRSSAIRYALACCFQAEGITQVPEAKRTKKSANS